MENIRDFAVSEGRWRSLTTASTSAGDIMKFESAVYDSFGITV
jgi:hypothetical protein